MKFTPHTAEDRRRMLERIGVATVIDLFAAIPNDLRLRQPLPLPPPLSEPEALQEASRLAALNRHTSQLVCFAGAGAYDHYVPATVDAVISRPEFYTAYTPYQPEVSQGTLQSIYEYQSLVCRLFEMEVANASMYDCASALAETAHMVRDITRRSRVVLSAGINPVWTEVIMTYARGLNIPLQTAALSDYTTELSGLNKLVDDDTAAVFIQHPNFFGALEQVESISKLCHERGTLLVVAVDPISLGIVAPPGSYDADVAVAEGQALGLPLAYGGPYLGMMTTRRKFIRHLPGRLAARTADAQGRIGYVLALQTREQHIRRERATSNICTNQALCALAASVYLATLGRTGIREIARQCLAKSHYLAAAIAATPGFHVDLSIPFFNEFVVCTRPTAAEVVAAGIEYGILAGVDLGTFRSEWRNLLLVAVTERRTRSEMDAYVGFLRKEFGQ
uniref:Probable glycine dehydrogenase (decarboxylating) subunit 1 n=1 Tax=candidate division WOR-3 bacterium TaxID=2052148 RepID=A0A7C4GBY4_UNCW3